MGHRGFSLVELMITLAVAVVLVAIAVPNFRSILLSNRLTTSANEIVGALNDARMEAIKRNASAQLCGSSATANGSDTLGTACGTQTGAVYLLMTSSTATKVNTSQLNIADPLKLNGDMKALRFGADGLGRAIGGTAPYTGAIVDLCASGLSSNNHRIINVTAGSMVSVTTSTSDSCP